MELHDYGLTHEVNHTRRYSHMDAGDPGGTLTRKESDYIDHSLLQPEYMPESNTFIIDLMDAPMSFPKASNHNNSDLHFPNSLFQFVNGDHADKTGEVVVIESSAGANIIQIPTNSTTAVVRNSEMTSHQDGLELPVINNMDANNMYGGKHTSDFIGLSGEILDETGATVNKVNYSLPSASMDSAKNLSTVQQFPHLSFQETEVSLDGSSAMADSDMTCARSSSARKVLPHKKRISRKLKGTPNLDTTTLTAKQLDQNSIPEQRTQFICELCRHPATSQIEFFTHLKEHYEPVSNSTAPQQQRQQQQQTVLPIMDTFVSLDTRLDNQRNSQAHNRTGQCNGGLVDNNSVEQVFNNVELNFEDFHNNDNVNVSVNGNVNGNVNNGHTAMPTVNGNTTSHDDMHILNVNTVEKCMNFSTQSSVAPLKSIVADDMEFSDTEDMLEIDIRNVVDKVSIEDTCDDMDLMGANGIRESWFTNNHFIMPSPLKALKDVSFTGSLVQMLDEEDVGRALPHANATTMVNESNTNAMHVKPLLRVADRRKLFAFPFDNEPNDLSMSANANVNAIAKTINNSSENVEDVKQPSNHIADTMTNGNTTSTNEYPQLTNYQSTAIAAEPNDLSRKMISASPLDFTNKVMPEHLERTCNDNTGNPNDNVDAVNNGAGNVVDGYDPAIIKEDIDYEESDNDDANYLDRPSPDRSSCDQDDEKSVDDGTNHHNQTANNLQSIKCKTEKRKRKLTIHKCNKCNRAFNSSNALKYHLQTHTGLRPYSCDTCGHSFFAQSALKMHQLIHTGEKPFECDFCKTRFKTRGDLKYHISSLHTEEKSFQCEFCGKAFARKYSLDLHRRIHTSEQNYKCDICGKAYRAGNYLQNHRRLHTGEKPYGCKVCGKAFRISSDLSRHFKIHVRKGIVGNSNSSNNNPNPNVTNVIVIQNNDKTNIYNDDDDDDDDDNDADDDDKGEYINGSCSFEKPKTIIINKSMRNHMKKSKKQTEL